MQLVKRVAVEKIFMIGLTIVGGLPASQLKHQEKRNKVSFKSGLIADTFINSLSGKKSLNCHEESQVGSEKSSPINGKQNLQANKIIRLSFTGLRIPDLNVKLDIPKENTACKDNIDKLIAQGWKNYKQLEIKPVEVMGNGNKPKEKLVISAPDLGEIGYLPKRLTKVIIDKVKENPELLSATLSNARMIRKRRSNILVPEVSVNINWYKQKENEDEAEFEKIFKDLVQRDISINSSRNRLSRRIFSTSYPVEKPEEYKEFLIGEEIKDKGEAVKDDLNTAIAKISSEIKQSPKILIIGHKDADGDTIGSIMAIKEAIRFMDATDSNSSIPNRQIDCAIDEVIPANFSRIIEDMGEEIKQVKNTNLPKLQSAFSCLNAKKNKDEHTKDQINLLEQEIEKSKKDSENSLKPDEKYDMVILADIPTPERLGENFKQYLENAKKVVFLDHHPYRPDIWNEAKSRTGFDMEKAKKDNTVLIFDTASAEASVIPIIVHTPQMDDIAAGKKSVAEVCNNSQEKMKLLKNFAISNCLGIFTDTGGFSHIRDRMYGLTKSLYDWITSLTKGSPDNVALVINKTIPNKLESKIDLDIISEYALKSKVNDPENDELGLGIIQIDYDKIFDSLVAARKKEQRRNHGALPKTNFGDIFNAFKYSREVRSLKKIDDGPYGSDKIGVLMAQTKINGELGSDFIPVKGDNSIRLSIRAPQTSTKAELLAILFNGGGHGPAAGGSINLPEVDFDTKLSVEITENGNKRIVKDSATILEKLHKQQDLIHDISKTDKEKEAENIKFDMVLDPASGKTIAEIIKDVVKEIRKEQAPQEENNVIPMSSKIPNNQIKVANI